MSNKGIAFAFLLCCGWPLFMYGLIEYLKRAITRRDWSNIQWDEIHWPWSKHD